MRRLATTLFAALCAATASAVMYLPETSPRTIAEDPMLPGEAAFARDGGAPSIYLGGERAVDPAALRGARYVEAELTLVGIGCTISNGETVVSGSATVLASAANGAKLARVDYEFTREPSMQPASPTCDMTMLDGLARFDISAGGVPCRLHRIRGWYVAFGDNPDHVNDLTELDVRLRDEMGDWELLGLRPWVTGMVYAADAPHWSEYPASNTVHIGSQVIRLGNGGRPSGIWHDDGATNLVLALGATPAIRVSPGHSSVTGTLAVTNFVFDTTNRVIRLAYESTLVGATDDDIKVLVSSSLEPGRLDWREADPAHVTRSNNVFTIDWGGKEMFIKLVCYGAASEAVRIDLAGSVHVAGSLYVGGTNVMDLVGGDPVFEAWTNRATVAVGKGAAGSGTGVAIGQQTSAANAGIAVGAGAKATGANGVVVGNSAQAAGPYSAAFGPSAKTGSAAMMSVQLGNGTCDAANTLQFGSAPLGKVDAFSQSTFTLDAAVKVPQAVAVSNYVESVVGDISTALDAILGGH